MNTSFMTDMIKLIWCYNFLYIFVLDWLNLEKFDLGQT